MKTSSIIKRVVLAIAFLGLCYGAQAQSTKKEEVTIAKETTMTQLTASVKIKTSNDKIFEAVTTKFRNQMKGYTVAVKRDRAGEYYLYSIPFKNDVAPDVIAYIKTFK